jgi:hypothetical protein
MIGPTMGILAYNIHVTYSGIATVLASRTAGGLLTNIVCGVFQKFVNNSFDTIYWIIGINVFSILCSWCYSEFG